MKRTIPLLIGLLILLPTVLISQSFGPVQTEEVEEPQQQIKTEEVIELPFALEKKIDPSQYVLGPGDELGLNILTATNMTFPLTVTPTGDLFIPAVGIVQVAGFTLEEVTRKVREFIHAEAYPGARVNLVLINLRNFRVQISGAVNKPGFVTANPMERLSDIVERAEGFHQLAREFNIEIRHKDGRKTVVDHLKYLRNGDLDHNPTFREGDHILVPFGDMKTEGIVLRGAVEGSGYDIMAPGEDLGSYLQRQVKFKKNADLESIVITRKLKGRDEFVNVETQDLYKTKLSAGETIDIQWEKGVMVNGFVLAPGGFEFFPGYTAADYISMAGGNTEKGNPNRCTVRHRDGSMERGQGVIVRRGDVIIVPRTTKDYLIGDLSVLQITVSLMTIYLTFLATGGK